MSKLGAGAALRLLPQHPEAPRDQAKRRGDPAWRPEEEEGLRNGITKMQQEFLGLRGSRTWHCHCSGCSGTSSIPGPSTSTCRWCSQRKKKKKKRRRRKRIRGKRAGGESVEDQGEEKKKGKKGKKRKKSNNSIFHLECS